MFETILYEERNHIAWVTLNRPDKLNAFTMQMNHELLNAFKQISKNDNVRAVVLTGEGRAFCSGQDLGDVNHDMDLGDVLRKGYNPMIQQMANLEKPIIGAINGVAAGAGFSLALACDFRIASENASFLEAFIHVGLIPDSGNLFYLPRLVGHAKALELAVLGEKVKADKALELGLVTKLFPAATWEDEVERFAEKLSSMPTKAIGLIKRYLYQSWDTELHEMLEKEAYAQKIAGQSEDHQEGLKAFMEKRKPVFKGN
ncbi:enoyl-CoA hydratase-related protein [Falsibacillus albus]|uniref:2-(1,2-epoxy-1,2-dihydrophenyl)acetyl-CoA isomerase n=1 Tax=Falsibacillus albus TaxID=2478915 RepID=A0A3L7K2T9_9BACI|nr:enoyl-CoA hydratase-related protein [Falsibacillus albus]RLQ97417.1 2-(1,2-epoxy-1,2-dihydrophenyl)acetyl-CoA isomerase [Falsibacillus albus]